MHGTEVVHSTLIHATFCSYRVRNVVACEGKWVVVPGLIRKSLVVASVAIAAVSVITPPALADPVLAEPGTVVSESPLPQHLWLPGAGAAHRVTYVSTGPSGERALSTGAVFVPSGTPPEGGWPVVSWAHGTVGIADHCAPSTAGTSVRTNDHLNRWMSEGYAIVATDYVGLGTPGDHPYLDGRTAAYSVTDMVRAARRVSPTLSRRWVAMGQSQGGHATLFTASLATRYAPELDFRGAVTTGAPSNLAQAFALTGPYIPDLPLGGLIPYTAYLFAGLKAARPDFDPDSYLTAAGKEAVEAAHTLCYADLKKKVEGLTIGKMLSRSLLFGDFYKTASSVLDVPLTGYDRPFFIAQGVNDLDVPIVLTMKLVADLKLRGVRFTHKYYPGADHGTTPTESLPDTVPFVKELFN
ncbi:lipase family protein [Thermomonospora umbrina]|uniref:Secretory lipase n=1 Tax=Thermomonospora umbrina TaxID=111806 RepID=A0A3D9SLL0_9ACTN|nr:lipase family protein [Thermomonospora umbrina]REE96799.1 secretory lipase [Thermomonospora umbrina]